MRCISFVFAVFLAISVSGCFNPFAPRLETNPVAIGSVLGSQQTIDGVFQSFQYAYTFKDTTIYGRLLDGSFVFIYTDYNTGTDVSWGRDEEIHTTYGLFVNAQRLDLVWNNIVAQSGDSLRVNVTRAFNLTVTFNPNDVLRLDGYVNLTLTRQSADADWKIVRWRDESNY